MEVKESELLDELLDKVPEFRDVFEYADTHWDEFDLAKQDSIVSKIDEMLKIPA